MFVDKSRSLYGRSRRLLPYAAAEEQLSCADLLKATLHQSVKEIRQLVELGVDPNCVASDDPNWGAETPLTIAVMSFDPAERARKFDLLLGLGARFDASNPGMLLTRAAERGDTALLRRMLDAGLRPDAPSPAFRPYTALSAALSFAVYDIGQINESKLGAVALLLERGADPNQMTESRFYEPVPVLHQAVIGSRVHGAAQGRRRGKRAGRP